jgi:hypothetical protein
MLSANPDLFRKRLLNDLANLLRPPVESANPYRPPDLPGANGGNGRLCRPLDYGELKSRIVAEAAK